MVGKGRWGALGKGGGGDIWHSGSLTVRGLIRGHICNVQGLKRMQAQYCRLHVMKRCLWPSLACVIQCQVVDPVCAPGLRGNAGDGRQLHNRTGSVSLITDLCSLDLGCLTLVNLPPSHSQCFPSISRGFQGLFWSTEGAIFEDMAVSVDFEEDGQLKHQAQS